MFENDRVRAARRLQRAFRSRRLWAAEMAKLRAVLCFERAAITGSFFRSARSLSLTLTLPLSLSITLTLSLNRTRTVTRIRSRTLKLPGQERAERRRLLSRGAAEGHHHHPGRRARGARTLSLTLT